MIRVVVVSTTDELARRLSAVAAESIDALVPSNAADANRLMIELASAEEPADVLVFGPGVPFEVALTVAARTDERAPGTNMVLAMAAGPEEWLAAMRVGIRDVVSPDAETADLRLVLERAMASARTRRNLASGSTEQVKTRGKVITVISPKGGSGKTTVSTNLAAGLAKLAPHQTVVVDLDLQFGDVASALNIVPQHSIAEAVQAGAMDAMGLKTFLTPHPSGLYALCAPVNPAQADLITGENVSTIIGVLAQQFRYVVVDTAPGLLEHTLAVLDHASDVVLVSGMDVPSIRGVHKELDVLRDLGLDRIPQHLVLNFVDKIGGLTINDVEAVIGRPMDIVLPRSKAIPLSTNRGVPLLQDEPRDPATKELHKLVGRFQLLLKKSSGTGPKHRALSA